MAKRPIKEPKPRSWAVYRIAAKRKLFVGLVHNQQDEQSAIKSAIEQYDVLASRRGRLIAQTRD